MVNCKILLFFVILLVAVPVITQVMQNVTLQSCYLDGCDKNGTFHCKQDTVTGKHQCVCYQGYKPPLCNDLDECSVGHRLCKDNGMCINTVGSYRCVCLPGWTGPHCSQNDTLNPCSVGYKDVAGICTDIDECMLSSVNPCGHGTCLNTGGSYSCKCPSGWSGNRCFVDIDECGSNPCHNGNCTDLHNGFSCSCAAFWTGLMCDAPITTLGSKTAPLTTIMSSTTSTRTITSHLPTTMASTSASLVTSPMTTVSLTTGRNTTHYRNSPEAGKDSVNESLIAGCVAGGILAIGGGILATILLHHFIVKRRKEISPGLSDQDTVIEVHQQACTTNADAHEPRSKNNHSIVGIPVDDAGLNKEFSMKTRFSIQRLFRH